ncbi:MAG: flagellar motor protein MotB [Deltaproteobacteria bacterium]|jgi:chemotaxis protein MotB|nr:flagellar motor protein MotB [Deltaproteobacteria bacterium]
MNRKADQFGIIENFGTTDNIGHDIDESSFSKPAPKSSDETPSWMLTYGDMMTLLLCFFVMLFILSKQEENKYKSVIGSIQNAFGVTGRDPRTPFIPRPDETDSATLGKAEADLMETVQNSMHDANNANELQNSLVVEVENKGVVLRIYSSELFEPGTARLKPNTDFLLQPVIAALNRHHFNLLIRTNVTPASLNSRYFPSVWEFSAARSGAVLHRLITFGGIQGTRLNAMGSGDTDIRVPADDPKSEHYNNRTDFIFYLPGTEYW